MNNRNSLNLTLVLQTAVFEDDENMASFGAREQLATITEVKPVESAEPSTARVKNGYGTESTSPTSPTSDSDFDESLAVPPSLSIIEVSNSPDKVRYSRMVTDGPAPIDSVPFKTVLTPPLPFKSSDRKVFLPGVEISVRIIDNERSVTTHFLSPNLYTILLVHGDFTWKIEKRYKHILSLHQELTLFRAGLNIPFPSKAHRENRHSFRLSAEEAEKAAISGKPPANPRRKSNRVKKRAGALPRFPKKPEIMVSYDDLPKRIKQLEEYLYNLCNITIYRKHHELLKFLEVSNLSFIRELGPKGKEGMVMKRTGSTLPGQTGCDCCGLLHYGVCNRCNFFCSSISCGKWRERWFFLKDSCFGYVRPRDGAIAAVMLFDQGFEISSGMYSTGLGNGLQILNLNRQMVIRLWSKRQSKDWKLSLQDVSNSTARDFTSAHPHHSFVPVRSATKAYHFVDGAGYFSAVADCLEGAKEEIYITDWWLSPEIHLKRPAPGDYWRLDQILKRKAAQGVKIFILLYKEVQMALGINSYYSKSQLNFDNIKVLRHPDHAKVGVFLWAHHEKMVCIDQSIAFIGGIDLCYGRWDDHNHKLTDLGDIPLATRNSSLQRKTKMKTSSNPSGRSGFLESRFGGEDFESSSRLTPQNSDATTPKLDNDEPAELQEIPLEPMPAPTTPPPRSEEPLPVLQPGDHLMIQPRPRPSGTSGTVFLEEHYNPDIHHKKTVMDTITGKSKDFFGLFSDSKETGTAVDETEKRKAEKYAASNRNIFFPENEGSNLTVSTRFGLSDMTDDEDTLDVQDQSVQQAISEMDSSSKLWMGKDYANFIVKDFTNLESPFVDLVDRTTTPRMPWHDIAMMVEGEAARDAARHFIQRWNAHKLEKCKKNTSYPYLLPKSYTDIKVPDILHNLKKYTVTCQILRSLTCWSGGFLDADACEQSIHEAYIESITRSQHYIYIENQFFITLSMRNIFVRNQIGEALFNRIMRAHRAGAVFRVFVVMPLLPAFEGEVGASNGISLHAITHWNYQSISRGEDSLIERLKDAGVEDPSQYVTFHGLRTHTVLDGEPVTELIYVHSKLMIVDDRVVICGSANINDRSMLGKRDSEVAVIIQDESFEDGRMNGEVFPSGSFAGSLRKRLFREHLGLIERKDLERKISLKDPTIDSFYRDIWLKTSKTNTETYENVFHCIPTDSVTTFAGLKKYQEEYKDSMWVSDPAAASYELDKINGHLVNFPLDFLVGEVLTPPNTSMEGIMPTSLWT